MIKTGAYNIAKGEKKETKGKKIGGFDLGHFEVILNFFSKRVQKIVFLALLFILGTFLAVAILELGLRAFSKKTYGLDPCVSLDKNFHHVMIPDSFCRFKTDEWDVNYQINSLGLRDKDIASDRAEAFRVLFLGDSFAQGHGVDLENSMSKLLEKKLNKAGGRNFEVVNAGVFGYSPLVEYLWLLKEGVSLKPDLVIVAFSVTDFFEDRQRFRELLTSYPELLEDELENKIEQGETEFNFGLINTSTNPVSDQKIYAGLIPYEIKQWLRNNLKTYGLLADFIKKKNQPVQQDSLHQGDIDRDIVAIMRGDKIIQSDYEKLFGLPLKHLAMMRKLLDENNIPLVLIGVPDAVQVSDSEWPNRTALGYPVHFEDPRGPFQDELAKRLRKADINFIDLLEDFKTSNIFPLYFTRDGHFRESGHQLSSDLIFDGLQSLDLTP